MREDGKVKVQYTMTIEVTMWEDPADQLGPEEAAEVVGAEFSPEPGGEEDFLGARLSHFERVVLP